MTSVRPWVSAAAVVVVGWLAVPGAVSAHTLSAEGRIPLPLFVYVAGAAAAVGLSFAAASMVRGSPPTAESVRTVPPPVRLLLRAIGLLGWLWIVVQTMVGGSSSADVSSLFLWTYGWVGLALISAILFPIWRWLDPFTTIYDILAATIRRLGIRSEFATAYPRRLGYWPAVAGFGFFVWLELVARVYGGSQLGLVMIAYTLITLAAMAQFGRDEWRERGEVFSVWFRLLNRMAPIGGETDETVVRRPFLSGLAEATWPRELVALVAIGAAAIIYDGLSQTQLFFDLAGFPGLVGETLVLAAFLGLIVGGVLFVAGAIGDGPVGAGLVPVAVGYMIAHYFAAFLIDAQRIVIALSDPLQQGEDYLGTAFFEPSLTLPASLAWTIQLGAVVGGHVLGAWAGHGVIESRTRDPRRPSQLPLALLMIVFTGVTLWSLGQALSFIDEEPGATTELVTATNRDERKAFPDGSLYRR